MKFYKGPTRESIVFSLDFLISESGKNIDDKTKLTKMEAWHIGLEDIADEDIARGLKKALQVNTNFVMACGDFRKLCEPVIDYNDPNYIYKMLGIEPPKEVAKNRQKEQIGWN